MLPTLGQQTPSSFAWSASEISTDFWAGLIPCSGQQADMMIVLTDVPIGST